jgi:hypothetical protein
MTSRFILLIWVVLMVVPVLPVALIYRWFDDQNYFNLQYAAKGIVAVGPIAAYVVMVWLGWKIWGQVSARERRLREQLEPFLGSWQFTALSSHGNERSGTCTFEDVDGEMSVSGDFCEGMAQVGTWSSEMVWRRDAVLCIVYTLREIRDEKEQRAEGLVRVIAGGSKIDTMLGTWAVVGADAQAGTIKFLRVPS